jgi:uncharacterized protein (DUF1778 family)
MNMGRKKLPKKIALSHYRSTRYSREQLKQVEGAASTAGLTLSDFMRRASLIAAASVLGEETVEERMLNARFDMLYPEQSAT